MAQTSATEPAPERCTTRSAPASTEGTSSMKGTMRMSSLHPRALVLLGYLGLASSPALVRDDDADAAGAASDADRCGEVLVERDGALAAADDQHVQLVVARGVGARDEAAAKGHAGEPDDRLAHGLLGLGEGEVGALREGRHELVGEPEGGVGLEQGERQAHSARSQRDGTGRVAADGTARRQGGACG